MEDIDLAREQEYLDRVISEIKTQLKQAERAAEDQLAWNTEYKKSVWEDESKYVMDFDEIFDAAQYNQEMNRNDAILNASRYNTMRLVKSLKSAYFGKILFSEDGQPRPEDVYIGIQGVVDRKSWTNFVYDWRAPISSIFYDYELGRAKYQCPAGEIEGDVLGKRQYKISGDKIDYILESAIKIDDEILQEVLSKSADDKMRNIVATIQREQNRVIRDEGHDLLMVSGPAGSGKTSIALHRIAYLLYSNRNTITSDNIIVFSPNRIFSDYISSVMPELGEENMLQTTFVDYAEKVLGTGITIEDMSDQMEFLLSRQSADQPESDWSTRVDAIKYKSSPGFLDSLKAYADTLRTMDVAVDDLVYDGNVIMDKAYISRLFKDEYSFLPVGRRLSKLKRRFLDLLRPYELKRWAEIVEEMKRKIDKGDEDYMLSVERREKCHQLLVEEFRPLKEKAEAMFSIDYLDIYRRLFAEDRTHLIGVTSEVCRSTEADIVKGIIRYEDVAPLLYIRGVINGVPSLFTVKYVVIDEVQDYSPIHFEVISQLLQGRNFTILGDFNQSIHPYINITDYQAVPKMLGVKLPFSIRLKKTYRSTQEIAGFASCILPDRNNDIEMVNRSGEMPKLMQVTQGSLVQHITLDIAELLKAGAGSIGIICRSAADAASLYGKLKDSVPLIHLTKDDNRFKTGIVILPSYLAKGLEFDAVIVPEAGASVYSRETERRLLYTVCTRALHHLHLFYTGALSPLLSSASSMASAGALSLPLN